VPPLRRRAYEHLLGQKDQDGQNALVATPAIAAAVGLPTNTVRRALEHLAAYQLVRRVTHRQGNPDMWGVAA
jgi:hypothetical protein